MFIVLRTTKQLAEIIVSMPTKEFPTIPGYRITRLLGRGGMASVYAALEVSLEREVAIKVVSIENAEENDLLKRLVFEAKSLASLRHPHIVGLYRFGQIDKKTLFYVMPLLRGGDLSKRLLPMPEMQAHTLIAQLADALGHAHAGGIVHRDVKPENVLFDEAGHAQLTDFGAAFSVRADRMTREGFAVGSLGYMSPEQARGQSLSFSSDLYSLAVLGFELLTGKRPHSGEDAISIALAQLETPPEDLPESLLHWQGFFAKALAPNPAVRFQDALNFKQALPEVVNKDPDPRNKEFLASEANLSERVTRHSGPTQIVPVTTENAIAAKPKSKWLWPALAAIVLAISGLVLSNLMQKKQQAYRALEAQIRSAPLGQAQLALQEKAGAFSRGQEQTLAAIVVQRLEQDLSPAAANKRLGELAPQLLVVQNLQKKYELIPAASSQQLLATLVRRTEETLSLSVEQFDRDTANDALRIAEILPNQNSQLSTWIEKAKAIPAVGEEFTDPSGSGLQLRLVAPPKASAKIANSSSKGLAVMSASFSQSQFDEFSTATKTKNTACDGLNALPARACISQAQAQAIVEWLNEKNKRKENDQTNQRLTRFELPRQNTWAQVREYAPKSAGFFAMSSECRIQSYTQMPNAFVRGLSSVKKTFGGQPIRGQVKQYCDGPLSFSLAGGTASSATPERTVLVLIARF
jgi:serine/threonine protein kinase